MSRIIVGGSQVFAAPQAVYGEYLYGNYGNSHATQVVAPQVVSEEQKVEDNVKGSRVLNAANVVVSPQSAVISPVVQQPAVSYVQAPVYYYDEKKRRRMINDKISKDELFSSL